MGRRTCAASERPFAQLRQYFNLGNNNWHRQLCHSGRSQDAGLRNWASCRSNLCRRCPRKNARGYCRGRCCNCCMVGGRFSAARMAGTGGDCSGAGLPWPPRRDPAGMASCIRPASQGSDPSLEVRQQPGKHIWPKPRTLRLLNRPPRIFAWSLPPLRLAPCSNGTISLSTERSPGSSARRFSHRAMRRWRCCWFGPVLLSALGSGRWVRSCLAIWAIPWAANTPSF